MNATYIIKRLLLCIPMLFGITLISFVVMQMAPGQSGAAGQGGEQTRGRLTQKQQEAMQHSFFLDKPVYTRYFYWLGVVQPEPTQEQKAESIKTGKRIPLRGLIFGDLGQSMSRPSMSVWELLADAIPITILMNFLSLVVIYVIAIPLGVYSATHQYSIGDRVTTVGAFMFFSMPSFWVAVMLIKWMVGPPPHWPNLDFQGIQPENASELSTLRWLYSCGEHLILPVFCMSYAGFAALSRYMRSSMIEVISADFIRTARAKGVKRFYVIYKHALRNSLIPIITLMGGILPGLIGGSVILETIFGIPGMGFLGYRALLERDYTVLMAENTIVAVLVMIGFLASDLLYSLADPRISLDKAAQ